MLQWTELSSCRPWQRLLPSSTTIMENSIGSQLIHPQGETSKAPAASGPILALGDAKLSSRRRRREPWVWPDASLMAQTPLLPLTSTRHSVAGLHIELNSQSSSKDLN